MMATRNSYLPALDAEIHDDLDRMVIADLQRVASTGSVLMEARRADLDDPDDWTIIRDAVDAEDAAIKFLRDWMFRNLEYSDVDGDPVEVTVRDGEVESRWLLQASTSIDVYARLAKKGE